MIVIVVVTSCGVERLISSLSILSFGTSPTSITLTVLTAVSKINRRKDSWEGSKSKEDHRKRREVEMRRGKVMTG